MLFFHWSILPYRRKRDDVIDKDCTGIPRVRWRKDSGYMEGLRGNVKMLLIMPCVYRIMMHIFI